MSNKLIGIILSLVVVLVLWWLFYTSKLSGSTNPSQPLGQTAKPPPVNTNPLSIDYMKKQNYPGSNFITLENLPDGSNYRQSIVSYQSDGLNIHGLLTVPDGTPPAGGWPVIIFNHGYINPKSYQTNPAVGQYAAYLPYFAKSGYVVFKSDYRGNGQSDGNPDGAYYSPAYAIDVLNAVSSVKKLSYVNPNKIGMWGHSMGGNVTLRELVVNPSDIKVAVIWGGVVCTYNDLMNNWQRRVTYSPGPYELALRNRYRQNLINQHDTPQNNPTFWNSIDPNYFLADIQAPIQLDASRTDEEVPWSFSDGLNTRLKQAGKTVEFYTYENDNHNLAGHLDLAMQRSIDFFNRYLKGGE